MSANTLSQVISQKLVAFSFPQFDLRRAWIVLAAVVISLLVFYIYQIKEATKFGFYVFQYEKEIAMLSQENKNLEVNFSQNNSLANLENLLKRANYEKVSQMRYIHILEGQVAAK